MSKKIKIFISVGMSGRNEKNVRNDIKRVKEKAMKIFYREELEFIDNFDCPPPKIPNKLYYLGEAIKKLGECDYCIFADGWKEYKGCKIELEICKQYGIEILYEYNHGYNQDKLYTDYKIKI